jgi:hypothetical protein
MGYAKNLWSERRLADGTEIFTNNMPLKKADAGKGGVYRPVDRDRYRRNFAKIDWSRRER